MPNTENNEVLAFSLAIKDLLVRQITSTYKLQRLNQEQKPNNKTVLVLKTRMSLATDYLWWFIHKAASHPGDFKQE